MKWMYKVFDVPVIGKKIKSLIIKHDGGMQESKILRLYVKEKYKVEVGMYTYGGVFLESFNNGGTVEVGRYCSFASDVHYFGANHPMNKVSMSPYFYNPIFGKKVTDVKRESLSIGHDVWLGYGAIITNKCHKIGNGAVIAAGAIVTKDVPAYAIVAGNPARILRYRFSEEIIEKIEQSKWWEKTPDELMEVYDSMDDPILFCEKVNYKK